LGKGGTILGLIGLILGAGGIGLGGFAWLTVSNLGTQVGNLYEQTTWYKQNATSFYCNPPNIYLTFIGLTIEFELGLEDSVHFSFMAWAHTESTIGWSRLWVYFRVDGIIDTDQHAEVGTHDGDETVHFMIPLQDVRNDLPSGLHTVTVVVYGTSSAIYISDSSLFVQKLTNNI
jgi:hypothetical protein